MEHFCHRILHLLKLCPLSKKNYKRKISESRCSYSPIHYNQLVTICTENFICDEFTFTARILRYSRMQLLSGGNYDIDIDDFKSNTRYTGGYCEGSRTIKIFWEVLEPYWWLLHTCTHIAIPFPIHDLCIPNSFIISIYFHMLDIYD
jgi:hypothetical protein